MKILWLDINASYSHSNLAFPSLHAQLSDHAKSLFSWDKISGTINTRKQEIINQILNNPPDIIFGTAWLFNHDYLLSILAEIKVLLPNVTITLGGPEFLGTQTENETYLRRNPFINYIFRGEAEEKFESLLLFLKEEKSNTSAYGNTDFAVAQPLVSEPPKGLCFIRSGIYVDGGMVEVESFAAVLPPEKSEFFDWSKPFIQLETSRGCFNSCTFCVSGVGSRVQNISIALLKERLDRAEERGIKEIRVLDRTFNANLNRAKELLELFRDYAGRLNFHLEIHPAFVNEAFAKYLRGLPEGLIHVEAGIQSLNEEVLSGCRRKGGAADSIRGLERLRDVGGFELHTDLIIGLPGYSYVGLIDDVLELVQLDVDEVQIETLKSLPGTYIRNKAADLGVVYSPNPPYAVLSTDDISYGEIDKAMTLSRVMDLWYNSKVWRSVFRELVLGGADFLNEFVNYNYFSGLTSKSLSLDSKGVLLYEFCEVHYPDFLPKVAIAWVSAGLSMKKKPAEKFIKWKNRGAHYDASISNPHYDPSDPQKSYYYLKYDDSYFWWVSGGRDNK